MIAVTSVEERSGGLVNLCHPLVCSCSLLDPIISQYPLVSGGRGCLKELH